MKQHLSLLLWLARTSLFISSFTFGGGYVVVPMIRRYYVQKKKLFTEEELLEMAAIAQSTPGAIAVNLAALAGYRTAGKAGLFVSCICTVIPPLFILSFVSLCYSRIIGNPHVLAVLKGMEAAVSVLIMDYIVNMLYLIKKENSKTLIALTAGSFIFSLIVGISPIIILVASCIICVGRSFSWKRFFN